MTRLVRFQSPPSTRSIIVLLRTRKEQRESVEFRYPNVQSRLCPLFPVCAPSSVLLLPGTGGRDERSMRA